MYELIKINKDIVHNFYYDRSKRNIILNHNVNLPIYIYLYINTLTQHNNNCCTTRNSE